MSVSTAEEVNPGSYNRFITEHGLTDTLEARSEYSVALEGFRLQLAARQGVGLDDLHMIQEPITQPTEVVISKTAE